MPLYMFVLYAKGLASSLRHRQYATRSLTSVATTKDLSLRLPNQDMADAGSICRTALYSAAAKPSQSSSFSGTPVTLGLLRAVLACFSIYEVD